MKKDVEYSDVERVIVFNPHPFPVSDSIELSLDLGLTVARRVDHDDALLVEYTDAPPDPPERLLVKRVGEPIGSPATAADSATLAEILSCSQVETLRTSLDDQPVMYRANRVTIRFVADELPPCGYRSYEFLPLADSSGSDEVQDPALAIENDTVRVAPNDQGTLAFSTNRPASRYRSCSGSKTAATQETSTPTAVLQRTIQSSLVLNSVSAGWTN